MCPHGLYPADGEDRWVALAVRDRTEWQALCGVIGRPEWAEDDALATVAGRRARIEDIDDAIAAWSAEVERDAAAEALLAAGVPAAPVLELAERDVHPHWTSRGFRVHHDGDGFDECDIYATPWLLSATPAAMVRPTPKLGEHNDYVYRELLGLDEETVARLVDEGVLV
jgi:crotonobetainyl-CoA:carnitine CoA-transferase CaiB-like acyl-CoA transferase